MEQEQQFRTNMKAPTIENYKKWYNDRIERTKKVMEKQNVIPGHQVLTDNLSASYLYKNGYILNTKTDCLEKDNGRN